MVEFSMKAFDGFFKAVLQLKTLEDCQKFCEDVCTIKELQAKQGTKRKRCMKLPTFAITCW